VFLDTDHSSLLVSPRTENCTGVGDMSIPLPGGLGLPLVSAVNRMTNRHPAFHTTESGRNNLFPGGYCAHPMNCCWPF
jgi:hypothetical protein